MSLISSLRRKLGSIIHPKPKVGEVKVTLPMIRLGSGYGGWAIDPRGLSASSVVYSFGIGEDVSFDLALIERFGCVVHAFDPTPRSIKWCKSQNLPAKFVLHEYGVAGHDGTVSFFAPDNPDHVSHTMVEGATRGSRITVPVKRLSTIMKELGHPALDLLKMDIEGAEYPVVEDLLTQRIPIDQLLVEYHHRFESIGPAKTQTSLDALDAAGYKLFCISDSLEEYSFKKM